MSDSLIVNENDNANSPHDDHPLINEMNGHKREKTKMIYALLDDIKKRKTKHYKKYVSLKSYSVAFKAIVNALNSVSVCSLVLTFTEINEVVNIVALSATTLSTLTTAILSAFELESKVYSHQTSYLQYVDMHRDLSAKLFKNGLSSKDLDNMLTDLNARLGLIEDNSPPIDISVKN